MATFAEAYRPYPPPRAPYVMRQSWHHLLFMHWRIAPDELRRVVPAQLPLDTFDGAAYIGIVPFEMRNVRPRLAPAVPRLSFFPELNVRTYVTRDGRPGVYFFSLDASNPLAVALARATFHLPYYHATMECNADGLSVEYSSTRTDKRAPPAFFRATYAPLASSFIPTVGSLEYFLTARYCLYTLDSSGNVLRAEIHHRPWQLQPTQAEIETNTMTEQIGLTLPAEPPLLHYAHALDMVAWMPQRVNMPT